MDTVTEARLAITLAQEGGIGVVHKNMSADAQAREVLRVKKYETGIISDPITVTPDQTVGAVIELCEGEGELEDGGDILLMSWMILAREAPPLDTVDAAADAELHVAEIKSRLVGGVLAALRQLHSIGCLTATVLNGVAQFIYLALHQEGSLEEVDFDKISITR